MRSKSDSDKFLIPDELAYYYLECFLCSECMENLKKFKHRKIKELILCDACSAKSDEVIKFKNRGC